MPNQIATDSLGMPKSRPMTTGKKIGIVSRMIDSSSVTVPNAMCSATIATMTQIGATFQPLMMLTSWCWICVRASAEFMMSAPMKITKIMAELCAVA